jgi:hypothetical protein
MSMIRRPLEWFKMVFEIPHLQMNAEWMEWYTDAAFGTFLHAKLCHAILEK